MMSTLSKAEKANLNPFIIGKLDVDTIAHFDFASMPKELNPYLVKTPEQEQLQQDYEASVKIAENNSKG